MITEKDIADALDAMKRMREDMDDLRSDIFGAYIRLSLGKMTYEEAYEFWCKEVREKKDRWVDCKYCVRAFKDFLIDGGVSQDRWEKLKPFFAELNDTYERFQNVHREFIQKLNVKYSEREGMKRGYETGRKDGMVEALDIVKESNKRAVDEDRRSSKTPKEKEDKKELMDAVLERYNMGGCSMEEAVKEAAKKLNRNDVNIRSVMNQAYVENGKRTHEELARKAATPKL